MDLRGLRARHLEVMRALEETGQVAGAAARLGLSQPAASRAMAEIERLLGAPVCVREPRGVRLTPLGAALARRARAVLLELDEAAREIAEMTAGHGGDVRIGSVTAPMIAHVVPAVLGLRQALPGVRVHLEVATSDVLVSGLVEGRFDVVLARLPALADPADFTLTALEGERLEMLCDRDHPLAGAGTISLREAARHDWIVQPRPSLLRRTVEDAFVARGLALPERVIGTTSFLATLGLLRGGEALAPVACEVAAFLADDLASRLSRLALEPAIDVAPYALVTRARQAPSPAAARLCDVLLKRVGDSDTTEGSVS